MRTPDLQHTEAAAARPGGSTGSLTGLQPLHSLSELRCPTDCDGGEPHSGSGAPRRADASRQHVPPISYGNPAGLGRSLQARLPRGQRRGGATLLKFGQTGPLRSHGRVRHTRPESFGPAHPFLPVPGRIAPVSPGSTFGGWMIRGSCSAQAPPPLQSALPDEADLHVGAQHDRGREFRLVQDYVAGIVDYEQCVPAGIAVFGNIRGNFLGYAPDV